MPTLVSTFAATVTVPASDMPHEFTVITTVALADAVPALTVSYIV